jgi:hypothetical protein
MARASRKPASRTKAAMSGDRTPPSVAKQNVEKTAAAWKNAGKGDYYQSDQYKALMNQ